MINPYRMITVKKNMSATQKTKYKHKEGGDHNVPLPEHLEYLKERGVRAYRYGNNVFLKGGGYSTHIVDEFLKRINNMELVGVLK